MLRALRVAFAIDSSPLFIRIVVLAEYFGFIQTKTPRPNAWHMSCQPHPRLCPRHWEADFQHALLIPCRSIDHVSRRRATPRRSASTSRRHSARSQTHSNRDKACRALRASAHAESSGAPRSSHRNSIGIARRVDDVGRWRTGCVALPRYSGDSFHF